MTPPYVYILIQGGLVMLPAGILDHAALIAPK